MLSFISNALTRPTRHDTWNGPDHLRQGPRRKASWEIERDLAEARAEVIRRPGLF